jgi:hypothetical protein
MGLLEAIQSQELLPDLFSCNGILKAFVLAHIGDY